MTVTNQFCKQEVGFSIRHCVTCWHDRAWGSLTSWLKSYTVNKGFAVLQVGLATTQLGCRKANVAEENMGRNVPASFTVLTDMKFEV